MIPVLYNALETEFTNNGLGSLPDAISCVVTEQRNTQGGYWLEMEYPVNGLHYSDIAPDRIIYAAPAMGKTPQPFRIARINRPIDGVVRIEAPHVSAQLQKITTFGSFPVYTVYGGFNTFKEISQNAGIPVPFSMTSDIDLYEVQHFDFPEPTSLMNVLLGTKGSFLDKVGGEFEWDAWNIILHKQRGKNRGFEIRYGVNMTDIEAETDMGDLVTAVLPYWKGRVNDSETVIIGDLCLSPNASAFAYVRCVPLDVSGEFELETDQTPTKAQVTEKGQAFISGTSQDELAMSINVQYMPVTLGIGERKINLCDTVRVVHPDLGISATAKVVETKFNVLVERYDAITIGSIQQTIVDTVAALVRKNN